MAENTAEVIEFNPVWIELDEMFNDVEGVPFDEVFDRLVEKQAEEGHELDEPCPEAQELLDQWIIENAHEYLPDWRAAVARRQPGVIEVSDGIEPSEDDRSPSEPDFAAESTAEDAPTPFDEARLEADSAKNGTKKPNDRLKLNSLFDTPHKASPYWTERGAAQRAWGAENIGKKRLHAAAAILHSADMRFGYGKHGHAAVFDQNVMTLAAATLFAECGLRVVDSHALREDGLPTKSEGSIKVPRGARWQLRATSELSEINSFWTGKGQYPANKDGVMRDYADVRQARNVSIVTGRDIMVLDLDGAAGLSWYEERRNKLPDTPTQMTGSGGLQLVYRLPEGAIVHNTAGVIAAGVDIRGEGGQMMAGPSIHPSGNFYTWHDAAAPWQMDIATAPEWLIDAAQKASKKFGTRSRGVASYAGVTDYVYDGDGPRGFEEWLASIGDGEGQRGFDKPILSASISYYLSNGVDADEVELFSILRSACEAAHMKPERENAERYLSDDAYLEGRIEYGRDTALTILDMDEDNDEETTESAADVSPSDVGSNNAVQSWSNRAAPPVRHRKMRVVGGGSETNASTDDEAEAEAETADKEAETADSTAPDLDITGPLGNTLDEACATLDQRFKVVNIGGDMAFIRVPDFSIDNESRMEIWKAPALTRFHDDRKVEVLKKAKDSEGKITKKRELVNPVTIFAAQAKRHSRVEFAPPPASVPDTAFNLFGGYHLAPREGNCEGLKTFIKDVICNGDANVFKWVWHWMAHMIQRPGEKPGTALVLHGAGGAGKGTFGELICALVYPYSMLATDSEHVLGRFAGAALVNSIVCIAEEAFFAGDKRETNMLKSMITAPKQRVEHKHVNSFEMRSFTRFIFDSNDEHVVNIENNGSERRFCVMKVSDSKSGDLVYFNDLRQQIEGPELAALAYELQHYSPASAGMEWKDVRFAPETTDRKRMSYQSRNPAERALLTAISEGGFTFMAIDGPLEYKLNATTTTRISTQHCRDFLRPFANKFNADSDNVLVLAERIFDKNHGFVKSKGLVEVPGETEPRNIAYFEVPPADSLRDKMRELGYE